MSASGPLGDIRSSLAKKADARYREQIERLVPGIRTLGVRVPDIRAIAAAFAKANRDLDLDGACDILDAACREGSRDEMLVGCFVVARFRRGLKDLAWPRILTWLKAVDNWETCDQIAMAIAMPAIAANPTRLRDLAKLTADTRVWARRFAMAASAALNQGGRDMPEETIAVCAKLFADPEPMVQKSVAWALREVSRKHPERVLAILRENRGNMAPKVLREASEKLPPKDRAALLGK